MMASENGLTPGGAKPVFIGGAWLVTAQPWCTYNSVPRTLYIVDGSDPGGGEHGGHGEGTHWGWREG